MLNDINISSPLQISLVSLGCPKTLVDSEVILGDLVQQGMLFCRDPHKADVIVINTCSFLQTSKLESIDTITEMVRLKEEGKCKSVLVVGCLVERYYEEIQKKFKGVDAFLDTSQLQNVGQAIKKIFQERDIEIPQFRKKYIADHQAPLYRLTAPHFSYVKISEGCDNPCLFCVIPRIRGRFRSRSIEDIFIEVKQRIGMGAKEIILVGQDLTEYGRDRYGKPSLSGLLRKLVKTEGLVWLRLMYTYPASMDDEILDLVSNHENICNYIDMPLQHIDHDVLKSMGRRGDERYLRELVSRMHNRIKNLSLRTTFIVGYPGETEAQFNKLLDFIQEVKFERVGVFCYSREEQTRSFNHPNQISKNVKESRREEAMLLQQKISTFNNKKKVSRTLKVIVDKRGDDGTFMARSYYDAPEIDGLVYFKDSIGAVRCGDMINVKITGYSEYDLVGEPV